jgi:hypothetical protein
MPRHELRNTTSSARFYSDADFNVDPMLFCPPGNYRARAMSDERATDLLVPTLTVVADQASPPLGSTVTWTTNAPNGVPFSIRRNGTEVATGIVGTNALSISTTGYTAGDAMTCRVLIPPAVQDVTSAAVNLVSSFSLSDLFSGGEDGFALLPSLTTSFESSNNSDPAEVGDGVQFQTCSSGRGTLRNYQQTTSGNRPLLAQDGSTYALDFESGSSQRLQRVGGNLSLIGAGGITLFARIKLESLGADRMIILGDNLGGSNRQFQFLVTSAGLLRIIGFATGSGSTVQATGATTLATGTWYNVCGIFNTTNARVWVDTMTDAGVNGTQANTFGTLSAGSDEPRIGGTGTFDGLMALALCVNRSLTETERQNLATFASAL